MDLLKALMKSTMIISIKNFMYMVKNEFFIKTSLELFK